MSLVRVSFLDKWDDELFRDLPGSDPLPARRRDRVGVPTNPVRDAAREVDIINAHQARLHEDKASLLRAPWRCDPIFQRHEVVETLPAQYKEPKPARDGQTFDQRAKAAATLELNEMFGWSDRGTSSSASSDDGRGRGG